jgi:hypothetical protein
MNWIILIIAGLCETGFAFCLGKSKLAVGTEWWAWIAGFGLLYVLSAVLLAKATQTMLRGISKSYKKESDILWNFTKFLVAKDGVTVKRFAPVADPKDFEKDIEAFL